MTAEQKVEINKLLTGIPGMDSILCGGLPEYSFNIIAGSPGTGKSTLAHQIMFANASPERPAIYFTVLGEPTVKMLRYQQQFSFFDQSKIGESIKLVNLSEEVLSNDLGTVLARVIAETEAMSPQIVVVDSFRSMVRNSQDSPQESMQIQTFVQRLALHLTSWQATTFLIGEYDDREMQSNAVFTVADGLIWLYQTVERESIVRQIQIMKMRGQATMPGLHTLRIDNHGIGVFPRTYGLDADHERPVQKRRLSTGIAKLDDMTGGGIPAGDTVLVAGPTGSGKSVLASQFVAAGLKRGESAVIAISEQPPLDYIQRADELGMKFSEAIDDSRLRLIYLRPLDLSLDESLHEMLSAVQSLKAERVVIDSINGFEIALAPAFRHDFRESLYRVVAALARIGATVLTTVGSESSLAELHASPNAVSFMSDDIILQRYVEVEGCLRKVMTVLKMRDSDHSKAIHEYEVGAGGIALGERVTDFHNPIFGISTRDGKTDKTNPQDVAASKPGAVSGA